MLWLNQVYSVIPNWINSFPRLHSFWSYRRTGNRRILRCREDQTYIRRYLRLFAECIVTCVLFHCFRWNSVDLIRTFLHSVWYIASSLPEPLVVSTRNAAPFTISVDSFFSASSTISIRSPLSVRRLPLYTLGYTCPRLEIYSDFSNNHRTAWKTCPGYINCVVICTRLTLQFSSQKGHGECTLPDCSW